LPGAAAGYRVAMRLARSSLSLAAGLLLVVAAPGAAAPAPGQVYTGKTSQDRKAQLRVSASGTGLQMRFRERFSCRGRRDITLYATYVNDRPTIRPDGTFSYRKTYRNLRDPALRGRFTNTQRITGSFLDGDRRVRVRSVSRVFNKRWSCRSSITIRATRTGG
jgi:hypothetical protein